MIFKGYQLMKPLKWPVNAEQHADMRRKQLLNRANSRVNVCEDWLSAKLEATGQKWTRQAQWGYRLFDFWCPLLGVAVEIDGPEHDPVRDAYRDEYNFRRSGIVVLRVPNMDENAVVRAVAIIEKLGPWQDRRRQLKLDQGRNRDRQRAACQNAGRRRLEEYLEQLMPRAGAGVFPGRIPENS
jgi:very-short-patch-repair endonuclease